MPLELVKTSPHCLTKAIADIMENTTPGAPMPARAFAAVAEEVVAYSALSPPQMAKRIKAVEKEMYKHADALEFEKAAAMRDRIKEFQGPGLVA
jgi:excinuclease ABC subunit B